MAGPSGHTGGVPPEPQKYVNPSSPFRQPTPEWIQWNKVYGPGGSHSTGSSTATGGAGAVGKTAGNAGTTGKTAELTNPNASTGSSAQDKANKALQDEINALLNSQSSGGSSAASAAADLAERRREFDIQAKRDKAKQDATEVDALQQRLASLSGPKDAYADYFFSHGLLPPQGYKPAPVPLTPAQIAAYKAQGVSPAQLQQMLTGPNKPGADAGMLGSMAPSMATPPGLPQARQQAAPTNTQITQPPIAPPQVTPPPMPMQQIGTAPSQQTRPPSGAGGGMFGQPQPPVPSMAAGGQVPGPPGTPSLAVVHGGEHVTPAPDGPSPMLEQSAPPQGQGMSNSPGLHPAIAALVDAVSGLLQNPDFAPFVSATLHSTQATPGGAPSMAVGGTVPPPPALGTSSYQSSPLLSSGGIFGNTVNQAGANSTGPRGKPSPLGSGNGLPASGGGVNPGPAPLGAPVAGTQGVNSNSGAVAGDHPVMPIANMDPYTRALYDQNGRLHPYSAQQEAQMGTQGQAAVASYMGKVQGGDIGAYLDLVNRLKPQNGAPEAGAGNAGEGFTSA